MKNNLSEMNPLPSTHALLAEYTRLLNQYGPDDERPEAYLKIYEYNEELLDLAETARWLKKALLMRNPSVERVDEVDSEVTYVEE